jgi:hypothetical protein
VHYLGSSWDAWVYNLVDDFGVGSLFINPAAPNDIKTRYGHRTWCGSSGTDVSPYLLDSPAGNAVEQARHDDHLMMMSLANMVRFVLWYPPAAQIISGPATSVSKIIQIGRDRHFASPNKNSVKLCYVIQDAWWSYDGNTPHTWLNEGSFADGLVADCLDSAYFKISQGGIANRPIIGLYLNGGTQPAWDVTHLGAITTAITNAGLGTPLYVQMNANVASSNALGCSYITTYGPNSDSPGAGHHSYADQAAKSMSMDTTGVGGANAGRCLSISHCNDARPRGITSYTDDPIYTEWEQHLRDRWGLARGAFQFGAGLIHMYSVTETDEGDAFFPTSQMILRGAPYGSNPSYGVYLDGLINVRRGTFPPIYNDHYHAESLHPNLSSQPAGWTLVQDLWGASGGVTGAYKHAEMQNSTTTNARTMTVKCTRLKVYGAMRAGLGTIRFIFDGGSNVDVNQGTLVGTGYNQLLFDSGEVSNVTHTLSVARVSGTVGYDEWVPTMSR